MASSSIFTHDDAVSELVVTPVGGVMGQAADWYDDEYEGQLSVDVYQTQDSIVVRSVIAGVKPEDLAITLNNDVITIRGKRYQSDEVPKEDYFYQECYWGGFSRSVVLPQEVVPQGISAKLKNGVLTVVLPKAHKRQASVSVPVIAEASEGDE